MTKVKLSFYEAKALLNSFKGCGVGLTSFYVKRMEDDTFAISAKIIGGDEEKQFTALHEYYEWASQKTKWGYDANGSSVQPE